MLTSIIAQPIDGVFPLAGLQHLEHIVHEKNISRIFTGYIFTHKSGDHLPCFAKRVLIYPNI